VHPDDEDYNGGDDYNGGEDDDEELVGAPAAAAAAAAHQASVFPSTFIPVADGDCGWHVHSSSYSSSASSSSPSSSLTPGMEELALSQSAHGANVLACGRGCGGGGGGGGGVDQEEPAVAFTGVLPAPSSSSSSSSSSNETNRPVQQIGGDAGSNDHNVSGHGDNKKREAEEDEPTSGGGGPGLTGGSDFRTTPVSASKSQNGKKKPQKKTMRTKVDGAGAAADIGSQSKKNKAKGKKGSFPGPISKAKGLPGHSPPSQSPKKQIQKQKQLADEGGGVASNAKAPASSSPAFNSVTPSFLSSSPATAAEDAAAAVAAPDTASAAGGGGDPGVASQLLIGDLFVCLDLSAFFFFF
jgi:hypothetical protein